MKEQKPTRPIAQRPEVSVPDVPSAPNDGLSPPRRDGHRLDEWRFLSEASGRLNSSLKLADVLQEIASGVHDLVDCHFFTVLLWSESENVLRPAFALKFGQCVDIEGSISLGEGLTGVAAAQRRPVRVADLRCDSRSRRASGATMDVRSKLTIPLVFQERLVGVLDLESLEPGLFTEDHEHLLLALGAHMATALENARLHERLLALEERMERALTTAREIQKGLLPDCAPQLPGLDIGMAFEPARDMAGDFYDFLPYVNGQLAVALGDVAGKGYGAALYGSLAVGIMRGHVVEHSFSPAQMMTHMHEHLRKINAENRFLAMAYVLIDPQTRSLTLASSGLPHPYYYRGGRAERVPISGLPLGLFPDLPHRYEEARLNLRSGEVVVLCSDGLEDCLYEKGQLVSEQEVALWLERIAQRPAQLIAERLIQISQPCAPGKTEAVDDRTVIVVKATSGSWTGQGGI